MLCTKLQPGSKLRCINAEDYDFMTVDKIYEVISAASNGFCYIDDDGDQLFYNFDSINDIKFELIEKDSTTDIKIGDWVKLKEWESFLEVKEINGFGEKILLIEEGVTSWYDLSLGFIKQGEDVMTEKQEDQKQDNFQVGNVVWDIVYGKGTVSNTEYFIEVDFSWTAELFTKNGVHVATQEHMQEGYNVRTLFFSEPKIEAAVTRPFVPTLVGKKVVIQESGVETTLAEIIEEYIDKIRYKVPEVYSQIYTSYKNKVTAIYEVQSENLLKK